MAHHDMLQTAPPAILMESAAPGSPDELVADAIMRLTGLADQMRQTFTDQAWASIPSHVIESGSNPAAIVGTLQSGAGVSVPPMVGDLVLITTAVVSLPAGAVGTLQLGPVVTIPNLTGVIVLPGLAQVLGASDVRGLTLTTAATVGPAPAAVVLYGKQLAPTGSMAP